MVRIFKKKKKKNLYPMQKLIIHVRARIRIESESNSRPVSGSMPFAFIAPISSSIGMSYFAQTLLPYFSMKASYFMVFQQWYSHWSPHHQLASGLQEEVRQFSHFNISPRSWQEGDWRIQGWNNPGECFLEGAQRVGEYHNQLGQGYAHALHAACHWFAIM